MRGDFTCDTPARAQNNVAPETARPSAGIGSAKNRATLPTDPKVRKMLPIGTGFLDYFPDACAAVAYVSYIGNQQHNPGQPLHWDRSKSTDEDDTVIRHFVERGGGAAPAFDTDGCRHRAKMVWRAMAALQKEIEADGGRLFRDDMRPEQSVTGR